MENVNEYSDGQNSIANLPHSSCSKKIKGGWRAVRFILANETFEKLGNMSLIANMVVYLNTQYNMDITTSAQIYNIWSGFTNFLPILGAYAADAYLGKYYMLFIGSIASLLGMGFMSLGAGIPSLRPHSCAKHSDYCQQPNGVQVTILYLALALLAVGSEGLRPCNIAFGADQFDMSTEKGRAQLESFCNWWYFLFTIAILVALTVVVYIQTTVSWLLGFAIATVSFAFATTIFFLGRQPKGSIIPDLVKVIVAAFRKRRVAVYSESELTFYDPPTSESELKIIKLDHTHRFRFLDKAAVITNPTTELDNQGKPINKWNLRSIQEVEELKSILATIPVWVAGIVCFLPMTQMTSFGILQAVQMHKSIGSFVVPPAWMGLVPMIGLFTWIYLYERFYVPWTVKKPRKGKRLSMEQRIRIGILFSITCMVVGGLVESKRRSSALKNGSFESPTPIWLLVPQFVLCGLIEAFAAIAMMELLTSYWPEHVKTLGGAVFYLSLSLVNYLSSILIKIILAVTGMNRETPWLGGNDLNKNRLEYYYYTIAVLGALNLLYFEFYARHFLYSEVIC